MIKPEYFLEKHNIVFEPTDSVEEKMRKMIVGFGLQESYEGNEPYIFISYSHKDSALVLPAIKAIQDKGYPVWFDAGIRPGSEWAADIAIHLKNASLVLAFVSHSAFDSQNCKAEIVYAFGNRKPMLTVRLDKAPLPDGLDMQLSLSQMFDAFAYDGGDEFVSRLVAAPIIAERIKPVLDEAYAEQCRQAEEAEQKRLEAEEAQKRKQAEETLAAEEAKRKYQQAKEAARLRQQQEEAQQKRWEEEKREKEKQKPQPQPKGTATSNSNATREPKLSPNEQVTQADKAYYGSVEAALIAHDYRNAVGWFNKKVQPIEGTGPEAKIRVDFLRIKLSDRIYRDAAQMERDRTTRQEAGKMYRALPRNYRDAAVRGEYLRKKYAKRETVWGVALSVLYLGMHVGLSRFVLHMLPWYFDILAMLAPMLFVCGLSVLETKAFYGKMDTFTALMLFEMVIPCVVDAFLFQGIGVWSRILWTLCFTAISFLIWLVTGLVFFVDKNEELPKIK